MILVASCETSRVAPTQARLAMRRPGGAGRSWASDHTRVISSGGWTRLRRAVRSHPGPAASASRH